MKHLSLDLPSATADEQICANEAANAIGSDDEFSDINYKRNSNNRKRRVVFDFSDDDNEDENEEKVMSLSSPPEPQEDTEKASVVKEEKILEDKKELGSSKISNAGITLRAKSDATVGGKCEGIDTNGAGAPGSPKRRKILKTRIDDHGREGTNMLLMFSIVCSFPNSLVYYCMCI
jgi:DNA polymerase delta subunit 3